jgi:hypothetical protein
MTRWRYRDRSPEKLEKAKFARIPSPSADASEFHERRLSYVARDL